MRFYQSQKEFYLGVDLHARTFYISLTNKNGEKIVQRNFKNRKVDDLLPYIEEYRDDLVIALESCYCWYWFVDWCHDHKFTVIMGHPLYMKAIHGAKTKNDRLDSYKLALLAQSNMFPLSFVYPREHRPLRDLMRRRLRLVGLRSELFAHIQRLNTQENNEPLRKLASRKGIRSEVPALFASPNTAKNVSIDLDLISQYDRIIDKLEKDVSSQLTKIHENEMKILQSIPGIGPIIAATIMLEINDIHRFNRVQEFASYARLVRCDHRSAGKTCGRGNKKIGNVHLKRVFSQASTLVPLNSPRINKLFIRMASKHGNGRARAILAHKIGRAVFTMLKNNKYFNLDEFLKKH
jgi:transposase